MPELRLENSIVDDRYTVERCLGRGSYAEIFLALDHQRGDEPVIIKALNTTLQGTPDEDLERTLVENFQNEAIALDKVRHPNIIRRLGHGTAADLDGVRFHYLVLEYMPGGDMLSLSRRRKLGLAEAISYFKQVSEALANAHSKQVIHRDIKPNNLLLSEDGRTVKIADFGVAKMTTDDASEITRVGTNVYAPPEHHPDNLEEIVGEKLTPSADIYSLAKTIYTAMTGRAPRQFSRLPITELPPELSSKPWGAGLLAVLRKATEPRATDRYQTIQEFWEAFARLEAIEAANRESDPEATVVRSRLDEPRPVERVAARPNFQILANAPASRSQKPRIVVDLSRPPKQEGEPAQSRGAQATLPLASQAKGQAEVVTRASTLPASTARPGASAAGVPKKAAPREEAGQSFLQTLRTFVGSEWLRRAFILFLIIALIGLTASIYYHFAGRGSRSMIILGQYREGIVTGVANVNMRSEPRGDVMVVLPQGTRVRALDNRDGWTRIKVLEWPDGSQPDNGLENGWVVSRYIQYD